MSAAKEKTYLKWYQKLAYGAGDLASNCSYGLVASFVLLISPGPWAWIVPSLAL